MKSKKTVLGIIAAILVLTMIGNCAGEDQNTTPGSTIMTASSTAETEYTFTDKETEHTLSTEALEDVSPTSPKEEQTPTTPQSQPSSSEPLPEGSHFQIQFIDVGQADAALVACDGHYMLIDGGNKADSNVIYSVLKRNNITNLDIVVGTHAHEDHIGGLPGAFQYATAKLTLCPVTNYDSNAFSDFAKSAQQKGGGITVPKVGSTYKLGSATIKILGVNSAADANNSSIVLRIDYGQTVFLFAGDAEREAEHVILNSGADLKSTVLKVGHHGSDTSTTYPFLREIMPKYAVISVGKGNSYGHPTENTLSRLRDAEITVFRTDLQGDIICTSDGKSVTFQPSKNASADVFGGIGNNSSQQPETKPVQTDPPPADVPDADNGDLVWIPKTGKKYHSHAGCSNMKDPSEVTKEEAEDMGYTPCKKCW